MYFQYTNASETKLTEEQKMELDQPISLAEMSKSIYEMSNDKAPGIDGLPIEFYKCFYDRIKSLLFDALKYAIQTKKLHLSARRGVLSLIPKRNKPPEKLGNWRGLTLMCSDHKVLAKILSTRIKPILHDLIGDHQTGYMQGKFIGLNIRKLMDLLYYVEQENMEALMISIDFYKCFDTIEFQAIEGALEYFNFGQNFIRMIMTLYNSFHTCILYSGFISEYFYPTRGVHQGCAISGYLYILVAEILAINIKSHKEIKGITLKNTELQEKISQYVDDMYLLSQYSAESLESIVDQLKQFYQNTGLKVNFDKSTIFRIGALKNSHKKLKTSVNFKWADADINVLGIIIDEETFSSNYAEILQKINTVTQIWSQRALSLCGKTVVLNNLAGSLLVYQMQMLPFMQKGDIVKLNKIVENFIWRGKKPKIKLNSLQRSVEQGGLRLFSPECKDKSIKIAWVKRFQSFDPFSKQLALYCINPKINNQEIWYLNLDKRDLGSFCKPNEFWKCVMEAWCEYNFHTVDEINKMLHQRIWFNSHIRVNDKPIFYKTLMDKGIMEIMDIIDVNTNDFYTYEQLTQTFNVKIPFVDYFSLIDAIPRTWKQMLKSQPIELSTEVAFPIDEIMETEKITAYIYKKIIDNESVIKECTDKWKQKLGMDIKQEQIKTGFKVKKVCNIAKYKSFQYRLMHNSIFLNDRLFHFKIKDSQLCSFCESHKENYLHFFFECKYVKEMWCELINYIRINDYVVLQDIDINPISILINRIHKQKDHFANVICLIAKHKIFAAKSLKQKPNANMVIKEIKFIQKIEMNKAVTKKQIDKYNNKWKDNKKYM